MTFDYLQGHPDERQHWLEKVRAMEKETPEAHQAAFLIELELWRYFEERSAVVPAFRELREREGMRRTSMRNLAELLLRLWIPPRPKRPAAGDIPVRGR